MGFLKIIQMDKNKIIVFIVNENYNELLNLYRSSAKTFNPALFRKFNTGSTPSNVKTLIYEVKKAYSVEDLDIYNYEKPTPAHPEGEEVENPNPALPEGEEEENPTPALPEVRNLGLREEFPFLNDENCPDVLKIAVADKLTAYQKHQEANELLQKHANKEVELSEDELKFLAESAVEAHRENTTLYDELLYFKEKGTFLAKHPLFWKEKIQQEVQLMSAEELLKYKKASDTFFKRNDEYLKKSTSEERTKELQEKAAVRKYKNDLVDAKLSELK
jgi:hypothetical protein